MDRDKKDNLINVKFDRKAEVTKVKENPSERSFNSHPSNTGNPVKNPPGSFNNQTNPIYKSLFKFIHTKLTIDKKSGRIFDKFKPKDLF